MKTFRSFDGSGGISHQTRCTHWTGSHFVDFAARCSTCNCRTYVPARSRQIIRRNRLLSYVFVRRLGWDLPHVPWLINELYRLSCCNIGSDFVIQTGLHGSKKKNPHPNLPVNETKTGVKLSNAKGAAGTSTRGHQLFLNAMNNGMKQPCFKSEMWFASDVCRGSHGALGRAWQW